MTVIYIITNYPTNKEEDQPEEIVTESEESKEPYDPNEHTILLNPLYYNRKGQRLHFRMRFC